MSNGARDSADRSPGRQLEQRYDLPVRRGQRIGDPRGHPWPVDRLGEFAAVRLSRFKAGGVTK